MPSSQVHDLPALLGRQAPPDVPRRERDSDGAESWSHDAILAQGLVVALAVALALALLLAFVLVTAVAVVTFGRRRFVRRLRCRNGRRSRRLCGLWALALVLVLVLVVSLAVALAFALPLPLSVGWLGAGTAGAGAAAESRWWPAHVCRPPGLERARGWEWEWESARASPASGPWVSVPALGFSTRRPCRNGGSMPGCRGRRQNPIDRPTRRPQGRADSSCPAVQC